ncbi:hypothetical protein D3C77_540940 [compost metagenome]
MASDADKAQRIHLDLFPVFKLRYEAARQGTFLHVQLTHEVADFALGQIQFDIVDQYIDTDPICAVQHFGEVFRIAVLPPTDTRLIRIVDACHITALQGNSAVLFFEVCPLSHQSITDTEYTF